MVDLESKILNKKRFSELVEYRIIEKRIGAMEAVLMVCEDNQIDPLDVKKLLSDSIQQKIEAEARKLNLLDGDRASTLPGLD